MTLLASIVERLKSLLPFRGELVPWAVIAGDTRDACIVFRLPEADGPVSGLRLLYDPSEKGPPEGASPFGLAFTKEDGRTGRFRLEAIEPRAMMRLLYTSSVAAIQVDDEGDCHVRQATVHLGIGRLPPAHEFAGAGDAAQTYDVIVDEVLDHGEGGTPWQGYVRPAEWSLSIAAERIYVELMPPPPFDPGIRFTVLGTLRKDGESAYMDDAVLTPGCRLDAMTTDLSLEVALSAGGDQDLVTAAVDEITARHAVHHGLDAEFLVPALRRFGQAPDVAKELRCATSRRPRQGRRNPEIVRLSERLQAMVDEWA